MAPSSANLFAVCAPLIFRSTLSLSFNNRAAQPVNLPGNWIPYRTRLDQVLYKLEEPLAGGTRVTGYFKNIVEFPYKVQIYLQCLSEITISQT